MALKKFYFTLKGTLTAGLSVNSVIIDGKTEVFNFRADLDDDFESACAWEDLEYKGIGDTSTCNYRVDSDFRRYLGECIRKYEPKHS